MHKQRKVKKQRQIYLMAITLPVAVVVILTGFLISQMFGFKNNSVLAGNFNSSISQEDDNSSLSSLNKTASSYAAKKSDENDPKLILLNPWNKMPDNYKVNLKQLKNGHSVDEICYPDLQQMMDDCRAEGLQPVICSSYRTFEKQEQLYNNQVDKWISQGYSQENALKTAATVVAVPGTSEHHTGLAVDIIDINNQLLDDSQEKTEVQKWLMKNSWKYGFILRYASDKSNITGIIYEPWHYRYVGKEATKEIYEQGICLEEYLK